MKRDMDIIIESLKQIEEKSTPYNRVIVEIANYEQMLIQYNVGLILDAGLLEGSRLDNGICLIRGLTWSGHDFLDAARSENVMNKAKEMAKKEGLDLLKLPIEIIKGLLAKATSELLTL